MWRRDSPALVQLAKAASSSSVVCCGIEKPGVGLSQERSSPEGGKTRPGVLELRRRCLRSIEADQAPPCAEEPLPTLKDVPVLGPPLGNLLIQPGSLVQVTLCLGKHCLGGEPSMLMPCRPGRRVVDELGG
jgi:hypothetical protein